MATTACLRPMHSPSILQHPSDAPPSPRRIRFAPLPDPRRSVFVTDNGEELPIPRFSSSSHFPAIPTPSPCNPNRGDYFAGFDAASSCSSSSDSRLNSDSQELSSSSSTSSISATPTPLSTPGESLPNPPPLLPCSTNNKKSFSFFRSLKRSSGPSSPSSSNNLTRVTSVDRTPNASTTFSRRNISAEEILTLGTINLFRPASRDTCDGETSQSAWSLTRWSSAGSPRDPYLGSPLYRVSSAQSTRSTQSYQSSSTLKPKIKIPKRASNFQPPSRKGTRMLNGRVYGGKQNSNPFANARDEEPTFVEWGYGGMGSVKGATSAGAHDRWERLQNSQQEEDDASGMAWIKKRREQRERERKEREEHEKQSQATETPAVTEAEASPASPPSSASSSSASPSVLASPTPSQSTTLTDDEHVMTAINIPAPHHYLRHAHSRSASKDGIVTCDPRETKVVESESEGSRSSTSSTSDSDTDEEREDDSSSSGDDDEEEEEEERKTALGAGVEKISRHH